MKSTLGNSLTDPRRLLALHKTSLLDSPPEPNFDRIVLLASQLLRAPVALITLVDDQRQFFKAAVGLTGTLLEKRQSPLSHSYCQHVVKQGQPLVINDARRHPLVQNNLAIIDHGAVAYLGVPLTLDDEHILGSLAVIDHQARDWTDADLAVLKELEPLARVLIAHQISSNENSAKDRQFGTLVETSPTGIFQTDAEGSCLFVNQRWCEIAGLAPEQAKGFGWVAAIHPEDRASVQLHWQDSLRIRAPFYLQYRFLSQTTGSVTWVTGRSLPELDSTGKILGHIGTIEDISSLKNSQMHLQEALRQIGQQKHAIDQHAIVAITDIQGTITYANAKFCEISGYSVKELIGQNHRILKSGQHTAAFYADLYETISSGKTWQGEICNRSKTGAFYWLKTTIVPYLGPDAKPTSYVSIRTDITDLKRIQDQLRESNERFRLSFIHAGIGKAIISLKGTCIEANPALLSMLGYTAEELTRFNFHDLKHPEDRSLGADFEPRLLADEIPTLRLEQRLRHADGHYVWCRINSVVIRDSAQAPLYYNTQIENISASKLALEEKERIERKLAEAAKLESLGVLAGGIAHDFNNLLTGVLGNASLLRLELDPNSAHLPSIEQIELAARRAADLCKQMLAYSGKGRFIIKKIDLNHVVQETTRLLEISISKNCVLRYHLAPKLPPVEADETQMRQVIMNLVINASEAIGARSGVIALSTGVARVDANYLAALRFDQNIPPGDYVSLEVSDNGSGMDEATLAKIFDPFFTTKFAGRGLGLAAVQGIVRGHKGGMKVYSESKKGTTFRILLPCADGTIDPPGALSRHPFPSTSRATGTILIVDDEETVRTVAARIVETQGYTAEMAPDGVAAMALFRANPGKYKIVLLDLTMPHMDGEETFRQMRHHYPEVRVVLMSGFNHQDIITRFAGKGLAGFIQKPLEAQILLEEVRRAMAPQS